MKLWIIICVIAFVVLRMIAVCLANYIKNDKTERMKYILNLRKKLERDVSKPEIIKTVWGKGYRID